MACEDHRFWAKVRKDSDCWAWTGCKNNRGYGMLYVHGRHVLAHRVAFELHRGPIPEGLFCCHTCDNRACVNPDHLFLGTNADNMQDCARKGRLNVQRPEMIRSGEHHPMARLTFAEVLEMRKLYSTGDFTQKALARMFGVSTSQANNILKGRHWRRAA